MKIPTAGVQTPARRSAEPLRIVAAWVAPALAVGLCLLHTAAIWIGLGGYAGISGPWPITRDDHLHYFHNAAITPRLLADTGTTAGYDPSFMAGYPKCIFSVNSSTVPELVFALAGPGNEAVAYKVYVLVCAALLPWLVAGAGIVVGARGDAIASAVALFLVYLWTDFPILYAGFGMLPYLVSIPLALLVTAWIARYVERGGPGRWTLAAWGSAVVVLVHLTTATIVVPAALAAYFAGNVKAWRGGTRLASSRHAGVVAIPALVLLVNAFWWAPGVTLASAKGESGYVFSHPEPVLGRLRQIFVSEAPAEVVLIAAGLLGLAAMARRDRVGAWAVGTFAATGFSWGYLSGGFRSLDFLQPGRHTYVFYTAAALLGGVGFSYLRVRLRRGRLDLWATIGVVLIGIRLFGPSLEGSLRGKLAGPEPFLSSRAPTRLIRLVDRLRAMMKPGERLLYEEGGFGPDPFQGGRYSGLLPHLVEGIELLGGPYLHMHVTSNFTQFGEGKLFGEENWGRDHFVRYARLYRPAAIACWSREARAFCLAHPDLIRVVEDDGVLLVGRVLGFEGATIRGKADVTAGPNRIEVRDAVAGEDGRVVLRYHIAPHLVSDPPVEIEAARLEGDPVPFIAFKPNGKTVVFRIRPAPWSRP